MMVLMMSETRSQINERKRIYSGVDFFVVLLFFISIFCAFFT